MTLPEPVRAGVSGALGRVTAVSAVGGGCISSAMRVEVGGHPVFLKFDRGRSPGFFGVEAEGLRQLASTESGLRIPEVLACEEADGGWEWLAMEWIEPGRPGSDFGARLGTGLAALHGAEVTGGWGWERDGFIGSLAQQNGQANDWGEFWVERRLRPQLRDAVAAGRLEGGRQWDSLFERAAGLMAAGSEEGPSLLHGDLWSGNVMAAADGEPALVDPAAYRGHREVDLAMSELFGGFDATFYASYQEGWPLLPGYREVRRAIYQLYFLLVHVNIFGASYVTRTESALAAVLRVA